MSAFTKKVSRDATGPKCGAQLPGLLAQADSPMIEIVLDYDDLFA